jgi:hypothetical protein
MLMAAGALNGYRAAHGPVSGKGAGLGLRRSLCKSALRGFLAIDFEFMSHTRFVELGIDVNAEVSRMADPIPPMFWFRDPTGHALLVVESR